MMSNVCMVFVGVRHQRGGKRSSRLRTVFIQFPLMRTQAGADKDRTSISGRLPGNGDPCRHQQTGNQWRQQTQDSLVGRTPELRGTAGEWLLQRRAVPVSSRTVDACNEVSWWCAQSRQLCHRSASLDTCKQVKLPRFVRRSIVRNSPLKCSGMDHTVFTLQTHHACLYLVSIHQTAPPLY